MVKKKKSVKRAATRTVYRTKTVKARSRRAKSGTTYIPGAMATAALLAVNAANIKNTANAITDGYKATFPKMIQRAIPGNSAWVTGHYKEFFTANALITDAAAIAGGYLAGEVVKKYAPNMIKAPLGKLAKKIPRVI